MRKEVRVSAMRRALRPDQEYVGWMDKVFRKIRNPGHIIVSYCTGFFSAAAKAYTTYIDIKASTLCCMQLLYAMWKVSALKVLRSLCWGCCRGPS